MLQLSKSRWHHVCVIGLWALCALYVRPTAAQVSAPSGAAAAAPVLTRPPALLRRVPTIYPPAAQAAHRGGSVTLAVTLDAGGHVTDVAVSVSAGTDFDAAAVAAVRQFVFSPAEIDGQPAAVQIDYTEHFVPAVLPPAVAAAPPVLPVAITGTVRQRATRVPIAQAAVVVIAAGRELAPVLTDVDGHFEVRAPVGAVSVQVRDIGHRLFETRETIAAGEQLNVTYYLMPRQVGTFETVVHGQREKKEVTRRTLKREELESIPGSFGDPVRVIQNLPGLARTPYSVGGLIVRGAPAADTGTYFDGVQVPLLFHFGGGPSVINTEFVDRIDFFPGNFGARYGRAIGGILDITSRAADPCRFHGSAKINLLDSGVYVATPLTPHLTLSLAARRSYIDAILGPALRAAGESTVIVPAYYDYQARLQYKPGSKHAGEIFIMGSNDVLKATSARSNTAPFEVNVLQGFQRLMAAWSYTHGEIGVKSLAFFGFDQSSFGIGSAKLDTPATVFGVREDVRLNLTANVVLRFGVDAQMQWQPVRLASKLQLNYPAFPGARPNAPLETLETRADGLDIAEWVELEAKVFGVFTVLPSVRLDTFRANRTTRLAVGPRLTLRYDIGRRAGDTAVKAAFGLYSEQVPPQQANPVIGNPTLGLQRAMQASVGVEHRLSDRLSLDAVVFHNGRSNLAVATDATQRNAQGATVPLRYAGTGVAEAYGLEVFLRQETSRHFFGWLAYTLAWSQQRDAAGKPLYATTFDQRHILTAIGQYRFSNGWEVGGRFRLVSGGPITPVVGRTYAADTQVYKAVYGAPNSERLSAFHQLDLRVDKIWLLKTWEIGVYLDVQNIYNRQNADFTRYDYRFVTSQTIPDTPILPTFGVKGTF